MDTHSPCDPDSSLPCFFDDSDDTPLPPRSPSRLDFCVDDPHDGVGFELHGLDWAGVSHDDRPHTLIEEDTFPVDIAPLDRPRVVVPKSFMAKPLQDDEMEEIVIEPRAPVPVRPPSVQLQVDAQEYEYSQLHTTVQRLNYPHHSFSRSALLQQKNFWSSRHEEWAEWQSHAIQRQESTTNDAYTGLVTAHLPTIAGTPPYMRTPSSGLERDLADHPPGKHERDVHATIHPRAGDISALRDPYSVNIDRCFFRFPLWTLSKMLYVFNMHQRSTPSTSIFDMSPNQSSTSLSTLSSYSSSNSGDDDESDHTLVVDDSPVTKNGLSPEASNCAASLPSPPSWNHFWGWSWNARWEVLISLFQRDVTKRNALGVPMELSVSLESKETPTSPPAPISRFTVDNDDDDDDYGTIITTSLSSIDFEKERKRAISFYSREPKRAEVVL